ncbi:hypothetical protein DY000_02012773 [Brassica cretica]|uniref:Uncharacterized protein n=1 Tax=Brassica cretica TaxID=69181 RepID=A0ABQ7DAU7_BRACR|nr:hypothetical protein DY000_02012773 [Brassica cretica]
MLKNDTTMARSSALLKKKNGAGVCEILSVGQIGEERDKSETRVIFTVKGTGNMTRTLYVRLMLEGIGQLMDHIMVGAFRVLTVNHGFVYEPYALHEKISWWRRCLYVTYGSLRSIYSTQELAGSQYLYTICILLLYVATKG